MTKVAYNGCYGGFTLSHKAVMRYAELKDIKIYTFIGGDDKYKLATDEEAEKSFCPHYCTTPEFSYETYWSPYSLGNNRTDPILIQVIEELGEAANGSCSELKIADIPKGTAYRIEEYDGLESVETKDSYDWNIA